MIKKWQKVGATIFWGRLILEDLQYADAAAAATAVAASRGLL